MAEQTSEPKPESLELLVCFPGSAYFSRGIFSGKRGEKAPGYLARGDYGSVTFREESDLITAIPTAINHSSGKLSLLYGQSEREIRNFASQDKASDYLKAVWGFDEYMAMVPIIIDSENSEETRKEALDCFNELKDVLKGKQKILQTIPRFKEKFSGVLDMSPEEIYNHVINIVKERDNEK